MRTRLIAALTLCGAGLLGCPTTRDVDPMEWQPKFKPYRTTTQYNDGRSMRAPPLDTVSQEHDWGNPFGLVPDGGHPTPDNQEKTDAELVILGKHKWDQACAVCHGLAGDGNSIVARKMSIRQPPSLLTEQYKSKPDAYIFNVITNGFGYMNSYREQLSSRERRNGADDFELEFASDGRSQLHDIEITGHSIEPGHQQIVQGRGNLVQRKDARTFAIAIHFTNGSRVEQHLRKLFDKQRHSIGAIDNLINHFLGEPFEARLGVHHLGHLPLRKAIEGNHRLM